MIQTEMKFSEIVSFESCPRRRSFRKRILTKIIEGELSPNESKILNDSERTERLSYLNREPIAVCMNQYIPRILAILFSYLHQYYQCPMLCRRLVNPLSNRFPWISISEEEILNWLV